MWPRTFRKKNCTFFGEACRKTKEAKEIFNIWLNLLPVLQLKWQQMFEFFFCLVIWFNRQLFRNERKLFHHSLFCVSFLYFFRWLFLSLLLLPSLDVIIMIFHRIVLVLIHFYYSYFSSFLPYSSTRNSENSRGTNFPDQWHRGNTILWLELVKSTSSSQVIMVEIHLKNNGQK